MHNTPRGNIPALCHSYLESQLCHVTRTSTSHVGSFDSFTEIFDKQDLRRSEEPLLSTESRLEWTCHPTKDVRVYLVSETVQTGVQQSVESPIWICSHCLNSPRGRNALDKNRKTHFSQ